MILAVHWEGDPSPGEVGLWVAVAAWVWVFAAYLWIVMRRP